MNRVFAGKFLSVTFLAVTLTGNVARAQTPRGKPAIDFAGPPAAQSLYQCAWTNNLRCVQGEVGKNPAIVHAEDDRVMEIAAEAGSLPVLRYLHRHHGNLAANGAHLLALAVGNCDLEMFEYLVSNLPPLSQGVKNALMVTAGYGDSLPMARRVHRLGGRADVYVGMDSAVSAAAKHGSIDILNWLLNDVKADSHGRHEDALRQAAGHNRADSVRLLLAKGPAPDELQSEWTVAVSDALNIAVKGGVFAHDAAGYVEVADALQKYNSGLDP